MTVQINYKNSPPKNNSGNCILFVNEKFDIKSLKKHFSKSEFAYIADLIKISDLKKKIHVFDLNSKKKVILISIKKDIKDSNLESLGAELYNKLNNKKNSEYLLFSDSIIIKNLNFISYFLHGFKLKSYEF